MEWGYEIVGTPQGWRCPQCGRVYSPSQPMCLYCGGNIVNTTATINDGDWFARYLRENITIAKVEEENG